MKKKVPAKGATGGRTPIKKTVARIEQVEAKIEQVKAREEQAKAREEQAKAQAEQAKAREERAKTEVEQARTRAEQAEMALEKALRKDTVLPAENPPRLLKLSSEGGNAGEKNPLEQLTERQREILRLIAEGQNTKQIAELLKVSPKTVEYHRMKLMAGLNLRDIPGLVRFAVKVGLITPEN